MELIDLRIQLGCVAYIRWVIKSIINIDVAYKLPVKDDFRLILMFLLIGTSVKKSKLEGRVNAL